MPVDAFAATYRWGGTMLKTQTHKCNANKTECNNLEKKKEKHVDAASWQMNTWKSLDNSISPKKTREVQIKNRKCCFRLLSDAFF